MLKWSREVLTELLQVIGVSGVKASRGGAAREIHPLGLLLLPAAREDRN